MKGYGLLNKFDAFNTGVELCKRWLKDVPYLTNSILFLLDSLIARAVSACLAVRWSIGYLLDCLPVSVLVDVWCSPSYACALVAAGFS